MNTPEILVILTYAIPIICFVVLIGCMIYTLVKKTNDNLRRLREVSEFLENIEDMID